MFGKKSDKQPNTMSRYVDATGELPNRELQLAKWYLLHAELLRKIWIGILIAFCVGTLGYSLFGWIMYFFVGYPQDMRNLREQQLSFQNFTALQPSYEAQPILLSPTDVFVAAPGRYDFSTLVKNPNNNFVAFVTYVYVYDGGETAPREDILLPGDERPLIVFGAELEGFPTGAQLVIQKTSWRRVNPHAISDASAYIAERVQFPVSNVMFQEAHGINNLPTHQISFDVENASAYSYWQPVFYIEYMNGDQVDGVGYLTFERFRSGDTYHADLHSFADILSVSDIRVYPVINIFDSDVFMSPGT